ncbi:neuronal acetylcholine receptor subunit beta-3-like [Anopheles moucheti]|uniref:neuronal acetylcholine receptor subunit beta-3-like n=1 Tax=Anopheles moucheti TaxID=186751 RepID=UPI0022F12292|nr:neuronal acetylcholine receptor subunit beta-3-like [Anopheles moucheti]
MWYILLMIVALTKPAASIVCNKETSNVENALKQHLFCNGYNPKIRPAKSEFDMINITVLPVVYDFEVYVHRSMMSLVMNYRLMWEDASLQWNASDWSNITLLRPNYDEIWIPEFEHINSDYEGDPSRSCSNPHCVLTRTGRLICAPICKTSAKCSPDYTRWPYTTLTCHIWFANRDKELVDEINFVFEKKYIAASDDTESAKWCMKMFTSNQTTLDIPGATKRTVYLWTFGLQQTPHVELVILYFPTFVLVMLNMFICWLHSTASEKMKTTLMSLVCHFMLLVDMVIVSANIPSIVLFIMESMVLTTLLFVITLILRWMHDLHTTPPRTVIRWTRSLTGNRMMEWFVQTEYLSLGDKPTAVTNDTEIRNWPAIVKFADRCVFVLYFFIYLWLICIHVPLQHDKYNSSDPDGLCSN